MEVKPIIFALLLVGLVPLRNALAGGSESDPRNSDPRNINLTSILITNTGTQTINVSVAGTDSLVEPITILEPQQSENIDFSRSKQMAVTCEIFEPSIGYGFRINNFTITAQHIYVKCGNPIVATPA